MGYDFVEPPMPAAGTRLGPYEVIGPIGSGGMGEVWRARDTTLSRDVALKFLPESFASDPDRLARFQREAVVLASLNHPNIASIYGLEQGTLVLELVEGPTLADRIVHGPLPIDEALPIARQIAEALEAAHAQGIVHRDLKPANIKVRPDGTVKVLDFGLAKAFEANPLSGDASLSPTMTSPAMTRMGVILGTAAYMSPEQARAAHVDSRTDVWSFGVVLYEMLVGRTLFEGPTVSDTLAAVLRADPDWTRLPSDLSPAVEHLLRRCLQRDLKRRFQHMGDVRIELEDLRDVRAPLVSAPPAGKRWRLVATASVMSALIAGALAWTFKPSAVASSAPTSFIIRSPGDVPVSREAPIAISPDGRHLVYGVGLGVKSHLVHQSLDSFDPQSLEGTEDAAIPTFLPKGDAVGFFSKSTGRIERVSLAGGSVTKVVDAPDLIGCSWGADGTLVFDSNWGTPLRISRPGASAIVELTKIAAGTGQAHVWPQVLPGDRAALFTLWTGAPTWDEAEIAVVDLATGQQRIVLRGGAYGRYSPSGHLVFWRANALMAVRFDLQSLEVKGEPVKVLSDVRIDAKSGSAHFAISDNGTLAYINGRVDTFAESFIVDRSAKAVVGLDESESTGLPTFSPDGTRVALTLYRGGTFGIGVFDLQRKLLTPFALSGDNALEGWTRKGDRVVFQSNAAGEYNFYAIPVAGAGQPTQLFSKTKGLTPFGSTWSSDERSLVYVASGAKTGSDLWIVDFDKEKTPRPLLETAANEVFPSISPNGRFIAYTSDESGRPEIYVRPFPQVETGRQKISGSGGTMPRWGRDGTTIFYRTDQGIMAVNVAAGRGGADLLTVGQPSLAVAITGLTAFDPSPDARTFAIERVPTEKAAKEIHVVLNWTEELKRLVPTR